MFPLLFLFYSLVNSQCTSITNISLQLNWELQAEFSGYLAAQSLGFYNDECLRVTLLPKPANSSEFDSLLDGSSQFAITWLDQVFQTMERRNINLTLVAPMFRYTGMVLVALKSAGINTISDFARKRICAFPNGKEINLRMAIREYAMKWDDNWAANVTTGDFDLVEQRGGPNMLLDGRCDVISAFRYDELGRLLATIGPTGNMITLSELKIIDFNSIGIPSLEDCLIADTRWLNANEDLTVRFLRGSFRGWLWVRDHPFQALQFFDDRTATQQWSMIETNDLLWPAAPDGIGIMPLATLQKSADAAYDFDLTSLHWDVSKNQFYRDDLPRQAVSTLNQPGYLQWGPTGYGPGSSDYICQNYVYRHLEFCPPTLYNDTIIYQSGSLRAFWIFFSVFCVLLVIVISGGCAYKHRELLKEKFGTTLPFTGGGSPNPSGSSRELETDNTDKGTKKKTKYETLDESEESDVEERKRTKAKGRKT